MKRDYDTRISQNNYNVGDLVYCLDKTKTIGHCKKIDPQIWQGSFTVERKFSDLLFEIRGKPGTRKKIVHHDRLKRYHADSLPYWLSSKSDSWQPIPPSKMKSREKVNCKVEKNLMNTKIAPARKGTRHRKQTEFYGT